MIYESLDQLKKGISGVLTIEKDDVTVSDETRLRETLIDNLVYSAVFSPDNEAQSCSRWLIRRAGARLGCVASSIQSLYEAMGKGAVSGFTVPAINLRGITYHSRPGGISSRHGGTCRSRYL